MPSTDDRHTLTPEVAQRQPPHGRKRVLLVDDEFALRRMAATILANRYDVTTSACAAEALELLEAGPYEVLITDSQMPAMNGVTLLERVLSQRPEQRCLVVSASIHGESQQWLDAHAIGYLHKPYDPVELLALVDGAVGH